MSVRTLILRVTFPCNGSLQVHECVIILNRIFRNWNRSRMQMLFTLNITCLRECSSSRDGTILCYIQSQLNSTHTLILISININRILHFQLHLNFPCGLFSSRLPTKIRYAFSCLPCVLHVCTDSTLLNLSNNAIMKFHICSSMTES
jgi:hypothetical protein